MKSVIVRPEATFISSFFSVFPLFESTSTLDAWTSYNSSKRISFIILVPIRFKSRQKILVTIANHKIPRIYLSTLNQPWRFVEAGIWIRGSGRSFIQRFSDLHSFFIIHRSNLCPWECEDFRFYVNLVAIQYDNTKRIIINYDEESRLNYPLQADKAE